jgi:RTX calcium-binding nonapeptide repeat (4 copies)
MHLHALEPRLLMAAAVLRDTGIIDVTGTRRADSFYFNLRKGRLKVTVNGQIIALFRLRHVAELHVTAGKGDDAVTIAANVRLPCSINGGAGNDTLVSGTYPDTLDGGAGDDQLQGGNGNDHLTGGDGDDALYGQGGADRLDAGPGRDAVAGGIGAPDTLTGGPGDDRFLLPKTAAGDTTEDAPTDYDPAAADARVWFATGDREWSDREVAGVDSALRTLHHASTSDTRLLHHNPGYYWSGVGKETTFTRFTLLKGGTAAATNHGGGEIRVSDSAFVGDFIYGAILHEVGHNWESINMNPYWTKGHDFHKLSGWGVLLFPGDPIPDGMVLTRNGLYFYRPDAPFVSEYARTSPMEDFAETFKSYFLQPRTAAQAAGWTAKWDYIDAFLQDMNDNPMIVA